MAQVVMMPLGDDCCALVHDQEHGLLCVQRSAFNSEKLRLSAQQWQAAEAYLNAALNPEPRLVGCSYAS